MASGIEAKVCADIEARQMLGINKYGTTVAENPLSLRQWLEHAYQEALDQAIYLRRAMAEIDSKTWVGLTDEMIIAGGKALAKLHADTCGLDFDDVWKYYAEDHKADAKAAIEAAHGIKE